MSVKSLGKTENGSNSLAEEDGSSGYCAAVPALNFADFHPMIGLNLGLFGAQFLL